MVNASNRIESINVILRHGDTLMIDCDGVIWKGDEGLMAALKCLIDLIAAYKVYLISNASFVSRRDILMKLRKFGVHVAIDQIICTGWLAGQELRSIGASGNVMVLGEEALIAEIAEIAPEWRVNVSRNDCQSLDAVLVGMSKKFDYEKLDMVSRALRDNSKARFIATNTDPLLPTATGYSPGTGAIVAAVKTAALKSPDVILGKPNVKLLQFLDAPGRVVIIGDNLDTDIMLAMNAKAGGYDAVSVLVETGVHKGSDITFHLVDHIIDYLQ